MSTLQNDQTHSNNSSAKAGVCVRACVRACVCACVCVCVRVFDHVVRLTLKGINEKKTIPEVNYIIKLKVLALN